MTDWNNDPRTTLLNENARSSNLATSLAQSAALEAQSKARIAQQAALEAQRQSLAFGNPHTAEEVQKLQRSLEKEQSQITELQVALAKAEALTLEWMHSNEAFKQLARQYGKKLGLSDDERQADYDDVVINVAASDQRYSNTRLTEKVRMRVCQRPNGPQIV